MNPLEKLLAAAAKIAQAADAVPDPKARIALKESAATIRGTVATIRAALESETSRPAKFALFVGDEAPLPGAEKPKTRRAGA